MGPEQVLRAAAGALVALLIGAVAHAAPAPATRDRVAIIDLGPDAADATARRALAAAVTSGELEPVAGDGVEDALAGRAPDADAAPLAAALARAERAFGALDCGTATAAASEAIGIAAARQAAGLPVPELSRAYVYALLCADRATDVDAAMTAATRLRALGGSAEVPAATWAKYPEVDVLSNRDLIPVTIQADVPGAAIWIDHARAGASPLAIVLPAGAHVIAAATPDGRRGWAAGTAVRKQPVIAVATALPTGPWSEVARRVASWHGARPTPDELAGVLSAVHARFAIVRSGDAIEAWGRIGGMSPPRLVGGEHALHHLAAAADLVALMVARAKTWADHSPDPDQPLLVETPEERTAARRGRPDEPTKWWVYATVAGVIGAGIALVLIHDQQSDLQRVEVHVP